MIWHHIDKAKAIKELGSHETMGLSETEAEMRLRKYGENRLEEKKKKSMARRYAEQFQDAMVIILLAAAMVSFVVAWRGHDRMEFFEPLIIVAIVLINATMGVVQENKAEKALDALQNLSAPMARVVRDGKEHSIEAALLVPGDIVYFEAGDFVPGDGRLLASASLKSEESALTGESVPAEKDAAAAVEVEAPLGDRRNMIYAGCSIVYGRGTAVITATAMNTEMGKIAQLLEGEKDLATPLQAKLARLGKLLGLFALGICAVIFVIGLTSGVPTLEIFMTAVSLAVAAIPEGLPAIVTIVLALGVQRMAKQNAIVRRLPAVETLGSASVICSDKTGTLTQNRMTLVRIWTENGIETIGEVLSTEGRRLLEYGTLCSDATVEVRDGEVKHLGDPTESAIVYAAARLGLEKAALHLQYPREAELPFDSDRKLMTVVVRGEQGYLSITKGAFDVLVERCTSGVTEAVRTAVEEMSRDALRVLAVAYKRLEEVPPQVNGMTLESDLVLLGLVGMIDPPRTEAKEAVKVCRNAGIRPVMITGDHVVTASAIAENLGIFMSGDRAVTGRELASMSEEELQQQVEEISVYARVSPEDKIRIVKAWQSRGAIVSMTGDGVNDAPALKAADIGCAMGITGTDVAKGAADITLTDDNFATIVEAVREGRGIYDNIKKAVIFLLGTNIGEVLTVFLSMVFWQTSPLISIQLLWINLVTDSLPALALGVEPVERDIMNRLPKPKGEGIFAHGGGIRVLLQGALFALLTLVGFRYGWNVTGSENGGETMAFLVLAMSQVFHALNARSNHSIFRIGLFTNRYMSGAFAISVVLIAVIAFVPPISLAFGLIRLPIKLYVVALALAFSPVIVIELCKAIGFYGSK